MRWTVHEPFPKCWHLHFAWWPVKIGDRAVWLEHVERRVVCRGEWVERYYREVERVEDE